MNGAEAQPPTPPAGPRPPAGADPDHPAEAANYPAEVADFVEQFAAHLIEGGMHRMAARVFACLLAEDSGTLTAGQLTDRLRISPAAVSGGVGYLSHLHLITRERQPGTRRERYRVRHDVWQDAMVNRTAILTRWLGTVREGVTAVGSDTPAGRRLEETAEFLSFFHSAVVRALGEWQEHRSQQASR